MRLVVTTMIVLAVMFTQFAVAGKVEVEYHALPGESDLPFSEAVRVGHILYLSGQIGIDPATGKLAQGGISGETRQTMENIKTSLEKYGSSMAEVVKCTVYLADMKEWADMSKEYISFFPSNPPARSALATNGLALGARTEIECMATVN